VVATRSPLVLAVLVVVALWGAACGGDDSDDGVEAEPTATTTTPSGDDETASRGAPEDGARLLPGCREVGAAVERHLGEEVLRTGRGSGGGVRGNVGYSTEGCIVETAEATYSIDEYLAVDAGDGTPSNLAIWAQTEASAAAAAEADELAARLVGEIEAAGGQVDGLLDDDGDLVVLVDGTT
jgi:hypothetical protein